MWAKFLIFVVLTWYEEHFKNLFIQYIQQKIHQGNTRKAVFHQTSINISSLHTLA